MIYYALHIYIHIQSYTYIVCVTTLSVLLILITLEFYSHLFSTLISCEHSATVSISRSSAVLVDSKKPDNVGMVQFLSDLLGEPREGQIERLAGQQGRTPGPWQMHRSHALSRVSRGWGFNAFKPSKEAVHQAKLAASAVESRWSLGRKLGDN